MNGQPFRVVNAGGRSPMVLICDHASNRVPVGYGDLGLPEAERQRHIAWDIGAAAICELLAVRFDAPAILSEVSRLVVDCNRHFADASLAPAISDGTRVPTNQNLTKDERRHRWERFHQPYHQAIEDVITRKLAGGQEPVVVSIHSMTPVMKGVARPWQIAMCWQEDERLSRPMLDALRKRGDIVVGDNEPYSLDRNEDYSVPVHAMSRGLKHLQVEFRQDEVAEPVGQHRWARIFGDCLQVALST